MISGNVHLPARYDPGAVALSILIAIFAAYAAFDVTGRMGAARHAARWLWWTGGTAALTFGIWSMQYTAMLAFKLPIPVAYDLPTVIVSFLPALLGSAVALHVLSARQVSLARVWLASMASACGISGLHYISIASMRLGAVPRCSAAIAVISILTAILASAIALQLVFRSYGDAAGINTGKLTGCVIMGAVAVSGMHYTAMLGTTFLPSRAAPDLSHAVSISCLGTLGIAVMSLLVQALAVSSSIADRRFYGQNGISARILQSQEDERRRIARQLHETVAQTLAALRMSLGKVSRADAAHDPGIKAAIQESIALVDDSVKEVRTLSHLLLPPLLEEAGLLSALHWYASGFQERSGIVLSVDAPPEMKRLSPELETAVFRIVQESLTNIHRHSGSRTARIHLSLEGGWLNLEVEDQGRGLPSSLSRGGWRRPSRIGVGIAGMQERVQQLGGNLEFDSTRRGTRLRVTLPVGEDHA